MTVTRVVIADDDYEVRAALEALIGMDPEIEIVASVDSGFAAADVVAEILPDVLVMDVRMPGGGAGLVRALRVSMPKLGIVCFSADRSSNRTMTDAGAHAFLDKADPSLDLMGTVKRIHLSMTDDTIV